MVGGITVNYTFANGTATGGGVDFTATPGALIFTGTAGEVRNITVAIINEVLIESNETFTVQLGTPTNGVGLTGGGTATGTIVNDDNCDAGTTAPVINGGVPTVFCDVITTSLGEYSSSTPPSGSALTWSRDSNPLNVAAHLSPAEVSATITLEGSYYVFFYDAAKSCASPVSTISAQAPCTNVSSVVTISVNDCDVDTDGDGLFDGPEATLGTDPTIGIPMKTA